jgi:hypothetical protein
MPSQVDFAAAFGPVAARDEAGKASSADGDEMEASSLADGSQQDGVANKDGRAYHKP